MKILVTRPEYQADKLCKLIEQQGAKAVRFPVLEILQTEMNESDKRRLHCLDFFDWVIFTSSNAVNFALRANNGRIPNAHRTRFAAIGQATADTLLKAGLPVDLVPDRGFNSEALLATPELKQLRGKSCLLVRGRGGRELLAGTLRDRGATVNYLEVYQRIKPAIDGQPIINMLKNRQLDVITVTSVEALHNLVDLLGDEIKSTLLLMPLVVISDRIKQAAKQIGFTTIAVSAKPSDTEIIKTVTALISGE